MWVRWTQIWTQNGLKLAGEEPTRRTGWKQSGWSGPQKPTTANALEGSGHLEGLVSARTWGFKSPLRHPVKVLVRGYKRAPVGPGRWKSRRKKATWYWYTPLLFHASNPNHGTRPRVMVQPAFSMTEPKRTQGTRLYPVEVPLARSRP
jgi:hypothetical protein